MHPRDEIKSIERRIEHAKLQHALGRVPSEKARQRVAALEAEIAALLDTLAPYEKDQYRLKREFGQLAG